ncbi:MAG: ATP-grasp domain-containing protein [Streptosporangiaceae bacterium]
MTTCFGVTWNPLAPNVPNALAAACQRLGVPFRIVDLKSLATLMHAELAVFDEDGPVSVDYISPTLFYWQEQATVALDVLMMQGCRMLNSVAASLTADDKSATALALAKAGVAQVATTAVASDFEQVKAAAERYGYPSVIKRTRGGQGRWVRLAHDSKELERATAELGEEGPGMILVQPVGAKRLGESVRVIVTAGVVRAATVRHAGGAEWRSNISAGGTQTPAKLSAAEGDLALAATDAVGLGHAGVDLLRSSAGPVILEVNSCPDFTSMTPYVKGDLAAIVIEQTLRLGDVLWPSPGPRKVRAMAITPRAARPLVPAPAPPAPPAGAGGARTSDSDAESVGHASRG